MRDGMFGITFQEQQSVGMGVLIFDAGRIYGTDGGARYDGEYVFHENTGVADSIVRVTFPPSVVSVFEISHPYEWAIDVSSSFNPKQAGTGIVRRLLPVFVMSSARRRVA
jgi:T3SS negative regulator,GrlR